MRVYICIGVRVPEFGAHYVCNGAAAHARVFCARPRARTKVVLVPR